MNQVIAMHGWYSDSNYWNQWKKYFHLNDWFWLSVERGYGYIEPSEAIWKRSIKNSLVHKRVIICHSLGIHLLPEAIIKQASHIIFLNSFSRFIPEGKESRAVKIALYGMRYHIGKNTESTMLWKFTKKAKKSKVENLKVSKPFQSEISLEGRKRLKDDLDILISTQKLPSCINKHAKVLVVNGQEDEIVCNSTRTLFITDLINHLHKNPLHWHLKGEGHFIHLNNLIEKVFYWLES